MSAISRAKWPLFALCAGLGLVAWVAFPFSVDDAYITARYARRIVRGLGYTYNDGVPSDGVTGPLWLAPMIVALKLGFDPLWGAKLVGFACSLLAAACCVLRAQRRASGHWLAWWTAALAVSSVSLSVWSVAGLETGAGVLAFTSMALATTARPHPRGVLLGLSIALAAWLRPELCFAAAACVLCAAARDRVAALRALVLGLVGALALLLFRAHHFGGLLPLSAYAKPAELGHGLAYVTGALTHVEAWLALLLVAIVVLRGRREDRAHVGILTAHVVGCALAGGDWMPGFRLLAPIVPLAALTVASGARVLRDRSAWFANVVLTVSVVLGALGLVRELPAVRAAGQNRAQQVPELAKHLTPAGAIMAVDIGALGDLTGAPMLDLGGLVDPYVAHARGGHLDKRIDESWVAQKRPRFIVLHSARPPDVSADRRLLRLSGYPVEQRVARLPFVRSHYRVTNVQRYGNGYFYVIMGFDVGLSRPRFAP